MCVASPRCRVAFVYDSTMRPMLKKIEGQLARPSQRVRNTLEPARTAIRWATWAFVGIVVIIILWDIILARWDPGPNTWSEVVRAVSFDMPIVPWFLGALVGHLFHGVRVPVIHRDAGATVMGFFTLLVIGWSVFLSFTDHALSIPAVAGIALAGVAVSYVLWPLQRPGGWQW